MIDFLLNTPSLDYFKGQQIVIWSRRLFCFCFYRFRKQQGLRDNSRLVTRTAHSGAWLWRRHTLSPACSSLSDHVSWLNLASMAWSPFPPLLTVSPVSTCCALICNGLFLPIIPSSSKLIFLCAMSSGCWKVTSNQIFFFFFNQIL